MVLPGLVRTSPEQKRRDKLKTTGVALDHLTSPWILCVSLLRIHEVWGVGPEVSQARAHSLEFYHFIGVGLPGYSCFDLC